MVRPGRALEEPRLRDAVVTAVDHRGRVAVITGTTHGIGRVTARELARAGFAVTMLCRDLRAAEAVRREILAVVPGSVVRALPCDLAAFDSVRAAAAGVLAELPRIDLLVNNAGLTSARHRLSVDGYELNFAANHLGPFLLTSLLVDRMAADSRIVIVASRAHYRGKLDLDTIQAAHPRYSAVAAYDRSKLANVMHSFALARRLAGRGVTVNCLHPGVVATHLLPRWLRLIKPLITPVTFDAERGAKTTLYVALAAELAGRTGRYFDEHQREQPAAALANDPRLQEALWAASARWTGTEVLLNTR